MLFTIFSMRLGFSSSDEPAPLHPSRLSLIAVIAVSALTSMVPITPEHQRPVWLFKSRIFTSCQAKHTTLLSNCPPCMRAMRE